MGDGEESGDSWGILDLLLALYITILILYFI